MVLQVNVLVLFFLSVLWLNQFEPKPSGIFSPLKSYYLASSHPKRIIYLTKLEILFYKISALYYYAKNCTKPSAEKSAYKT